MLVTKLLPWDYGVRNLLRRPSRSVLTFGGLTIVVLLVLVVVGFIRGLEKSLAATGNPNVVLVYSLSSAADVENSSIPGSTASLLSASVDGVRVANGVEYVSPELYLATRITAPGMKEPGMGLVRGVTTRAPLVRDRVQIVEGDWPQAGEVLVGRLAHSKLGANEEDLAIGSEVSFDGRSWTVSGRFTAAGSAFESEVWAPLADLQTTLKRQDLSLVAVGMDSPQQAADVDMFCRERVDLELRAVSESAYYAALQKHYKPVRMLGWVVVALVAGSGVFAGLNTMYGAVVGRVRELATLQAMGYRRRAILLTLVQEATLLACAAALAACVLGLLLVDGAAVRFTMGAFMLRVDSVGVAVACAVAALLGVVGALPPAAKAMRLPVVEAIKAI
ncbi:ABC transporter permease [Botrimarina mediterranea]|uniref:FtsX-like permease family protein n=1 Tax=Botrimarina mediterranea TaxID=2528022 RepID=A0A518K7B0_9BACT|nr:ABC transporter permease [Botrimarina mediterranea]QDV73693.1 FtsX-like permease family protein [Botrimarina mediterranea]QDV78283.1 FtsX-like permease family protein [Planctomycetes bacterium K2D]